MQQTAKVGRNDACHCGSGKKYKKCHLPMEEAEAGEAQRRASEARVARDHAWNRWIDFDKAYRAADFREKANLLRSLLSGEDLPDEDAVLVCFEDLWDEAESAAEREIFGELADLLEARHAEVFDAIGYFPLECRVLGALQDGRLAALGSTFIAFTVLVMDDLENRCEDLMVVANRLAYHGHLDVLLQGFRSGWARLKEVGETDSDAAEAIARRGVTYEVLATLGSIAPGASFPEALLRQVRNFEPWEKSQLEAWLHWLNAGAGRWRREDFAVTRGEWESNPALRGPLLDALTSLTHAFSGYLNREAGFSWPRADLVSAALARLLEERMEGRIKGQPARKGAPDLWRDKSVRVLCPAPDILRAHLEDMFHAVAPDEFLALALCEGLPHWFAFLDRMGLVTETESRPIFETLSPVAKHVFDAMQT